MLNKVDENKTMCNLPPQLKIDEISMVQLIQIENCSKISNEIPSLMSILLGNTELI